MPYEIENEEEILEVVEEESDFDTDDYTPMDWVDDHFDDDDDLSEEDEDFFDEGL